MRRILLATLWVPVVSLLACHGPVHHSVQERIADDESLTPVEVPGLEYWLDDLNATLHSGGEFSVRNRTDQLVQYPCTRCHAPDLMEQPLAEGAESGDATEGLPGRAHLQILRPHGIAEGFSCGHCHDSEDPSQLTGLQGPVGFDQVYDFCATCHFEQRRDWEAGAHGKRLATWAGPRVIENCTGCHDPHAPAFETRLPATVFPAIGGSD